MIEAVRPARQGDGAVLAWLEDDARRVASEHRGGPELLAESAEVGEREWERRLADPDWIVLVATIDEVPVGALAGCLQHPIGRFEIAGVWVEEGARELGLGDGLLLAALEEARVRGATVAEATALPGDRATKNLYERFAMKARKLVVSRRLDLEPGDPPFDDSPGD